MDIRKFVKLFEQGRYQDINTAFSVSQQFIDDLFTTDNIRVIMKTQSKEAAWFLTQIQTQLLIQPKIMTSFYFKLINADFHTYLTEHLTEFMQIFLTGDQELIWFCQLSPDEHRQVVSVIPAIIAHLPPARQLHIIESLPQQIIIRAAEHLQTDVFQKCFGKDFNILNIAQDEQLKFVVLRRLRGLKTNLTQMKQMASNRCTPSLLVEAAYQWGHSEKFIQFANNQLVQQMAELQQSDNVLEQAQCWLFFAHFQYSDRMGLDYRLVLELTAPQLIQLAKPLKNYAQTPFKQPPGTAEVFVFDGREHVLLPVTYKLIADQQIFQQLQQVVCGRDIVLPDADEVAAAVLVDVFARACCKNSSPQNLILKDEKLEFLINTNESGQANTKRFVRQNSDIAFGDLFGRITDGTRLLCIQQTDVKKLKPSFLNVQLATRQETYEEHLKKSKTQLLESEVLKRAVAQVQRETGPKLNTSTNVIKRVDKQNLTPQLKLTKVVELVEKYFDGYAQIQIGDLVLPRVTAADEKTTFSLYATLHQPKQNDYLNTLLKDLNALKSQLEIKRKRKLGEREEEQIFQTQFVIEELLLTASRFRMFRCGTRTHENTYQNDKYVKNAFGELMYRQGISEAEQTAAARANMIACLALIKYMRYNSNESVRLIESLVMMEMAKDIIQIGMMVDGQSVTFRDERFNFLINECDAAALGMGMRKSQIFEGNIDSRLRNTQKSLKVQELSYTQEKILKKSGVKATKYEDDENVYMTVE